MTGLRQRWVVACLISALVVGLMGATPAIADTDVTPPAPFDFVADAGPFQTGYSVASPYLSIEVVWENTTDDTEPITYRLDVDGTPAETKSSTGCTSVCTKHVDVPDGGTHSITVTAFDSAPTHNSRDADHSLEVVVDRHFPKFDTPALVTFRRGPATAASIPLRFSWTASDVGTGIDHIDVGHGSCCAVLGPTATSYDFRVPVLSLQVWQVQLVDGVGNRTKGTRGTYVESLPASAIERTGGWQHRRAASDLSAASWVTSGDHATASMKVRGRSVAWVASRSPHGGRAAVFVDGSKVGLVNLTAARKQRPRIVWRYALPNVHQHHIEIVNRSSGRHEVVRLDALLLQKRQ